MLLYIPLRFLNLGLQETSSYQESDKDFLLVTSLFTHYKEDKEIQIRKKKCHKETNIPQKNTKHFFLRIEIEELINSNNLLPGK